MQGDEVCLVATHIDSGWNSPETFKDNVEQYLEEEEFDYFAYESSRNHDESDYEELADEVWHTVQDDEIDRILDRFDDFIHIGAYLRSCHRSTWERFLNGIYRREEPEEYTITFPLEHIATDSAPVAQHITEKGLTHTLSGEPWDDERLSWELEPYLEAFPNEAEKGSAFDYTLEREPEPEIVWEIRNVTPAIS